VFLCVNTFSPKVQKSKGELGTVNEEYLLVVLGAGAGAGAGVVSLSLPILSR